jgi:hypothetical protein
MIVTTHWVWVGSGFIWHWFPWFTNDYNRLEIFIEFQSPLDCCCLDPWCSVVGALVARLQADTRTVAHLVGLFISRWPSGTLCHSRCQEVLLNNDFSWKWQQLMTEAVLTYPHNGRNSTAYNQWLHAIISCSTITVLLCRGSFKKSKIKKKVLVYWSIKVYTLSISVHNS